MSDWAVRRRCFVISGPAPPGGTMPGAPATAEPPPARRTGLPGPSGRLPVGTQVLHLVDRSRPDPWAPDRRPRELMVTAWYPAYDTDDLPRASYLTPRIGALLEEGLGATPGSVLGARPHARLDAPVAHRPGGWPVLLFSHGWGGHRSNATVLAEDLASHGYVVLAVDHTYDAGAVEFPDGRLVRSTLPDAPSGDDDRANLHGRVADLRFVLDWATNPRPGNPLRHTVDPARVGVYGHSTGGSAAAELIRADRRVRAGANLDGTFTGSPAPRTGLDRPFLLLTADRDEPGWREFRERHRRWGRHLVVDGAGHYSLTDVPCFVEPGRLRDHLPALEYRRLFGTLGASRSVALTRAYLRAFFDQHLRGRDSRLLAGPSADFPEVGFRWSWPPRLPAPSGTAVVGAVLAGVTDH